MNVTLIWKERRAEKKSKTKEARRTIQNVHVFTEDEVLEFANLQAKTLGIEEFTVEYGEPEVAANYTSTEV